MFTRVPTAQASARMERDQYEADRYLELAYALGVGRGSVDPTPFFHVSDAACEPATSSRRS